MLPFTLEPGMSKDVLVAFHPVVEGMMSGTLDITTSAPDYPSVSVPLMGAGVKPQLVVDSTHLHFGEQHVGTTSVRTVRVMNTGSGPLHISSAAVMGAPFFLNAPPSMPFVLLPQTIYEFTVGFSPTQEGAVTGMLVLTTDDAAFPTVSIALAGVGVGSSASGLVLDPTSLDFGAQNLGTSSTRVVTATNAGFSPLFITSMSLTADVYPSFSSTTLPAIPFYLSPGSSLQFLVTFNPSTVGVVTGTLRLTTNNPLAPGATLALSGSGVGTLR
jgi:hypothetical protein